VHDRHPETNLSSVSVNYGAHDTVRVDTESRVIVWPQIGERPQVEHTGSTTTITRNGIELTVDRIQGGVELHGDTISDQRLSDGALHLVLSSAVRPGPRGLLLSRPR
jgi:hypothetical protein